MLGACESIVDVITQPGFNSTKRAIPINENVPNENEHTDFIAFDFGISENEKGEPEPQFGKNAGTRYSVSSFEADGPESARKTF